MNLQTTPPKPSVTALERLKKNGKLLFSLLALSALLILVGAFCNSCFYNFYILCYRNGVPFSSVLLSFLMDLLYGVLKLLPFLLLLVGLWVKRKWLALLATGLHVCLCFYLLISLAQEFLDDHPSDVFDTLLALVPGGVAFLGVIGATALFFTLLFLHRGEKFFPWILLLSQAGMILVQLVYMLGQFARMALQIIELNLFYSLNYLLGGCSYLFACISYLAFLLLAITVIKKVKVPKASDQAPIAESNEQEALPTVAEEADTSSEQ